MLLQFLVNPRSIFCKIVTLEPIFHFYVARLWAFHEKDAGKTLMMWFPVIIWTEPKCLLSKRGFPGSIHHVSVISYELSGLRLAHCIKPHLTLMLNQDGGSGTFGFDLWLTSKCVLVTEEIYLHWLSLCFQTSPTGDENFSCTQKLWCWALTWHAPNKCEFLSLHESASSLIQKLSWHINESDT